VGGVQRERVRRDGVPGGASARVLCACVHFLYVCGLCACCTCASTRLALTCAPTHHHSPTHPHTRAQPHARAVPPRWRRPPAARGGRRLLRALHALPPVGQRRGDAGTVPAGAPGGVPAAGEYSGTPPNTPKCSTHARTHAWPSLSVPGGAPSPLPSPLPRLLGAYACTA
jgi:hypothetical protein